MTADRYLEMCDQLGKEPNLDEMPPSWEDLPEVAIYAMNTFTMLGDRVYPDIGFIGKDYTNLPLYMDVYGIEDKELFLEILSYLESRVIEKSQHQLKRERDKLKRKN